MGRDLALRKVMVDDVGPGNDHDLYKLPDLASSGRIILRTGVLAAGIKSILASGSVRAVLEMSTLYGVLPSMK